MGWLAWAWALLLLAGLGLYMLRLQRWLALAACTVPLVLFYAAVHTARPSGASDAEDAPFRRLGSLQVRALGLSFPASKPVAFGGGEADDVYVDRAPAALARIANGGVALGSGMARGALYVGASVPSKDNVSLPHTWALAEGVSFCFAAADEAACAASAPRWSFVGGQLRFTAPGAQPVQTCDPREAVSAFSFLFRVRAWSGHIPNVTSRIYPLQTYGRPGCKGKPLFDEPAEYPFVFQHFDEHGSPWLSMLLGGGERYTLVVSGAALRHPPKRPLDGVPAIGIFRVDVADALPAPEEVGMGPRRVKSFEHGPSRLTLVRKFALPAAGHTPGRVVVQPDPQKPVAVVVDSVHACVANGALMLLGVADEAQGTEVRIPFLRDLGGLGAAGSFIRFTREPQRTEQSCGGLSAASFSSAGPAGTIESIPSGSRIAIGQPAIGQLELGIAEIDVPWRLFLVVLLISVACRGFIRWHVIPTREQAVLVAAVDALLVVRLLSAAQEAALGTGESVAVARALQAAAGIPLALDVLAAAAAVSRLRLWVPTLFGIFGWVGVGLPLLHLIATFAGFREQFAGFRIASVAAPLYAVGMALILARFDAARRAGGHAWRWALGLLAHSAFVVGAFVAANDNGAVIYLFGPYIVVAAVLLSRPEVNAVPSSQFVRLYGIGTYVAAAALLVAMPAVLFIGIFHIAGSGQGLRAGLADAGWAAAALFVVVVIIFIVATTRTHDPEPRAHPTVVAAAIALGILLVGALFAWVWDHDVMQGRVRVAAAIAGAAIGLTMAAALALRLHRASSALLAAPASAVIAVLALSVLGRAEATAGPCMQLQPVELASCLEEQALRTNMLRITRGLFPQRLDAEFSGEAKGMAGVFDELAWLTDEWATPSGHGFMTLPPRRGLDKHDNASAVHVIGPFGTAAGWLLVVTLVVPALASYAAARRRGFDRAPTASAVAMSMLAAASVYVVLANLQLVPFTGRNVHFTASQSGADLLEAFALALVAVLGVRGVPQAGASREG